MAQIQTAMINSLDTMCRTKNISEMVLQQAFINELIEQFKPLQRTLQDSLYSAVVEMFDKVGELLKLLSAVHQGGALNEATRIMDTLRLMNFLKDLQSEEAYIRCVHQLADLQAAAGNHTEAGLALQLHAERYPWDSAHQVEELIEPELPAQKAFERKESLYFRMVTHFEHGSSWQRALQAYSELCQQYQYNVFDFSKLARAQRAMAAIYEKIAKGDRSSPRYFRVVYRGLGFPTSLRDKQFVYEGMPTDRLATFTDRMQQLHPTARILGSNAEGDYEGQYLQVFPVSPHKDLEHTVYQRTKISHPVREYCLVSNPHKFTMTSRKPAGKDVAITDQLVDKVIYTTADTFPTILRRSEIISSETVTLSPIQAAIERTTRKTLELAALDRRISDGEDAAFSHLSEALLVQVGPESDSSVATYRSLLPVSEIPDNVSNMSDFVAIEPEEAPLDTMQNALKVALLDHALTIKRCLALYTRPAQVATKAELVPRFEATFEPELAILFPQKVDLLNSTPRASWQDHESPELPDPPEEAVESALVNGLPKSRPASPKSRQGRRTSLNPFKRNSVSSQNKTNDVLKYERHSRQASHTREPSITRRLSGLLREDKTPAPWEGTAYPQDRRGSQTSEYHGMGGSLRKRLSIIGNGTA